MAKVIWSARAHSWLREIHDYIAADNVDAAERTIQGFLEKAESLTEFPLLGHRLFDYRGRELRALVYGHYRIVYYVDDNQDVIIIGVFHGALDLRRHLD